MIDTGQVLSAADLEQQRRDRMNRENDPVVIDLRRQIRLQRKRIEDNEDDLENYEKSVELDAQRQIGFLKRKLFRRMRQIGC